MEFGPFVIAIVGGYLLGALPFAVIIARSHGVDIFSVGSGNPGATNVKRVLGSGPGNLCFFLDAAKGFLAAGWPLLPFFTIPHAFAVATAGFLAAVLGHSYSVFLKFRGGKGVAVTIGGLLAIMPLVIVIGLFVWVAVFYATKVVAIASIALAITLPVAAGLRPLLFDGTDDGRFALALAVGVLLIFRHRSNLQRLLAGEEHAFKKKDSSPQ